MSARPADGDAAETTPAQPAAGHRPQSLLSFLSSVVLDTGPPPLPSVTLLDLLADLGVTEAAGQATLQRMTHRGLPTRGPVGRTAEYAPTPRAVVPVAGTAMTETIPFLQPCGGDRLALWSHPSEVVGELADGTGWSADAIASMWPERFDGSKQTLGQQLPEPPAVPSAQ